jgi:hypothetical protein
MGNWALVAPDGTCEGVITSDGSTHRHVVPPGHEMVPVGPEGVVLQQLGHHARRCGTKWVVADEGRAERFDRARGLRADHAAEQRARRRAALVALDLGAVGIECAEPGDERIPEPGPAIWREPPQALGAPGWLGPVAPVRAESGLWLRYMTEPDVDELARLMHESEAYGALGYEGCFTLAHTWYTDALTWALVLDWRGEALQYEIVHFEDPDRRVARGGFVTRVSRERPQWFWREVSAPMVRALRALGYRQLSGHVRLDRKDYADLLVQTYGGENLGANGQWWSMRYELGTMLRRAQGWPARRSAGAGWTWARGRVALREVTDDTAAGVAREALPVDAQRTLDEQWELDAATLVVADVDGVQAEVYAVRCREGDEALVTRLSPRLPDEQLRAAALEGLLAWQQAAGYQRTALYARWRAYPTAELLTRQQQLVARPIGGRPDRVRRVHPFTPRSAGPDLVVRLLEDEDVAGLQDTFVATGLFPEHREATLRRWVEEWYLDPACWPLVHTWRGTPIQYETYHFEQPQRARGGFTAHVMRERPHWFWALCAVPVWQALGEAGVQVVEGRFRRDREEWIGVVEGIYAGAYRSLGPTPNKRWEQTELDVTPALAAAQAAVLPVRTLGPTWQFTRGDVVVREATATELAALPTWLETEFAGSPQQAEVLRLFDEGMSLDHGTVMVGVTGGTISSARMIRPRRPTLGALTTLSRFTPGTADAVAEGIFRWALASGYTQLSTWVPTWQLRTPGLSARFTRVGWHETATRGRADGEAFHEMTLGLAEGVERTAAP